MASFGSKIFPNGPWRVPRGPGFEVGAAAAGGTTLARWDGSGPVGARAVAASGPMGLWPVARWGFWPGAGGSRPTASLWQPRGPVRVVVATTSLTSGQLAAVENSAVPPTSSLTSGGNNPGAERSGNAWMLHRDGKSHHDVTPSRFG